MITPPQSKRWAKKNWKSWERRKRTVFEWVWKQTLCHHHTRPIFLSSKVILPTPTPFQKTEKIATTNTSTTGTNLRGCSWEPFARNHFTEFGKSEGSSTIQVDLFNFHQSTRPRSMTSRAKRVAVKIAVLFPKKQKYVGWLKVMWSVKNLKSF